ncbi:hypothetical protein ACFFQW_27860 [Umezawaea endophytica]|uniref:Uncharacterized protein n=1 Tax=Umezawaea endophytica TaxID=1654476 RepID=A0A9X2VH61_9PSEU|nr:hypothetical protein [Umezawaea endophytica]MCS7476615.1 hypothetical protein [Umezawaea endophytica]
MTERQDLRPLSTEDLLPEHDRDRTTHTDETRADDQLRADGYHDSAVDRADDTAGRHDDGFHDSATGRVDETDRSVVSDEYDDVETDADRKHDGTDQYDEQPAALEDERLVEDETLHDETVVAHDEPAQKKPTADTDDGALALFSSEEVDQFRTEWRGLQSDFVDSPRDAVQHADQLVAQVMQSLATTFADHKKSLEGQWSQGEQVETEELRVALRQYRAFFDKLLTV